MDIQKIISDLKQIAAECEKVTSGNVSHRIANIEHGIINIADNIENYCPLSWYPASEPPIPDVPYISVVFCKGRNGWTPFTGYGCDISPKKTVEFINCINDAADVLNGDED